MHLLAAAHAASKVSTGQEVMAGIVIVAFVILVLVLFGWRPWGRSKTVAQSPAASGVRATGRAGRRIAARNGKQAQPDEAA